MAKQRVQRRIGRHERMKELAELLRDNARRHRLSDVFTDFCALAALSISNSVDRLQFDGREDQYMQIIRKYQLEEVQRFPLMLAVLAEWLEEGFADCLGALFMSLELGDSFKGQFFTPYEVSSLMARLTMGDAKQRIERQGFITVAELACGAGGMVVACAEALREQGINYQRAMHVTACDIDLTAVHMAYLQLSLLHIPAIVVHGNSLAMTEWSHWVTPAHVLGGWDRQLRARCAPRDVGELMLAGDRQPAPAEDRPTVSAPPSSPADFLDDCRAAVVQARAAQLGLFE